VNIGVWGKQREGIRVEAERIKGTMVEKEKTADNLFLFKLVDTAR
jgi:hypothetical protein